MGIDIPISPYGFGKAIETAFTALLDLEPRITVRAHIANNTTLPLTRVGDIVSGRAEGKLRNLKSGEVREISEVLWKTQIERHRAANRNSKAPPRIDKLLFPASFLVSLLENAEDDAFPTTSEKLEDQFDWLVKTLTAPEQIALPNPMARMSCSIVDPVRERPGIEGDIVRKVIQESKSVAVIWGAPGIGKTVLLSQVFDNSELAKRAIIYVDAKTVDLDLKSLEREIVSQFIGVQVPEQVSNVELNRWLERIIKCSRLMLVIDSVKDVAVLEDALRQLPESIMMLLATRLKPRTDQFALPLVLIKVDRLRLSDATYLFEQAASEQGLDLSLWGEIAAECGKLLNWNAAAIAVAASAVTTLNPDELVQSLCKRDAPLPYSLAGIDQLVEETIRGLGKPELLVLSSLSSRVSDGWTIDELFSQVQFSESGGLELVLHTLEFLGLASQQEVSTSIRRWYLSNSVARLVSSPTDALCRLLDIKHPMSGAASYFAAKDKPPKYLSLLTNMRDTHVTVHSATALHRKLEHQPQQRIHGPALATSNSTHLQQLSDLRPPQKATSRARAFQNDVGASHSNRFAGVPAKHRYLELLGSFEWARMDLASAAAIHRDVSRQKIQHQNYYRYVASQILTTGRAGDIQRHLHLKLTRKQVVQQYWRHVLETIYILIGASGAIQGLTMLGDWLHLTSTGTDLLFIFILSLIAIVALYSIVFTLDRTRLAVGAIRKLRGVAT